MDAAQLAQTQAGVIASDLPNILGQQFWSIYTDGTILPLAFVLILFARSNRYKVMGKVGIIPSIFNVSEPLVFGLPIVLNPLFAIPFVLYKPICVIVAYIATSVGLVPKIMGINIPFGTPYIISGFMQGGWRIALLQIVLIIIGILIYLPFFKVADKIAIKEETAK